MQKPFSVNFYTKKRKFEYVEDKNLQIDNEGKNGSNKIVKLEEGEKNHQKHSKSSAIPEDYISNLYQTISHKKQISQKDKEIIDYFQNEVKEQKIKTSHFSSLTPSLEMKLHKDYFTISTYV